MINTRVNVAGMELSTPFLLASGPYIGRGDQIKYWVEEMAKNHWAGIVTKSYSGRGMKEAARQSKPYLWTTRNLSGLGMQNYAMTGPRFTEEALEQLAESTRAVHEYGLVIIASLDGAPIESYPEMTRALSETGVDAIEVNLGCPAERAEELEIMTKVTGEESYVGFYAKGNVEQVARIVSAVRQSTDLPVLVKLPAIDAVRLAVVSKNAGAVGISAINTVSGFMGIDIESTLPIASHIDGRGRISGISGPMIKPIALSTIIDIELNVNLPILGIGGISNWQDIVEFIMLGASAVQICTAFMWKGFRIGNRMYKGLLKFMNRKGYNGINDFRGVSLKYLEMEPKIEAKVISHIDSDKCNLCGQCFIACGESSFGAIMKDGDSYRIDINKCDGCGLCKVVCRRDAVTLISVS